MKNIFRKKAFSIVEVMVSFFVITMGVLGLSTLALRNINVQKINKNKLIASQLAQEGVELIRNFRDKDWLVNGGATFFSSADNSDKIAIYFDGNNMVVQSGLSGINDQATKLFLDNNNFYVHSSTSNFSGFSRLVDINWVSDHEMNIVSTVAWQERGQDKEYVVDTKLFDWK